MNDWKYNYSVGEFLDAISVKGKYFFILGPLIKFEIDLVKVIAKEILSPITMIVPDLLKFHEKIDKFPFFKLYDDFNLDELPNMVEKVRRVTLTQGDKLELHSATRIPSLFWHILDSVASTEDDKKVVKQIGVYINQLDFLHGMNYKLPEKGPEQTTGS